MGAYGAALTPPCATSCVCARTHLPQLKLGRYIPHILSYFHTSSVGPLDGKASALCADSQNPELNDVEERERITRYFAPAEDALTTWNYANLIVLLQVFFFCCRIPFAVVDHWAFRALLYALRPRFAERLPVRQLQEIFLFARLLFHTPVFQKYITTFWLLLISQSSSSIPN